MNKIAIIYFNITMGRFFCYLLLVALLVSRVKGLAPSIQVCRSSSTTTTPSLSWPQTLSISHQQQHKKNHHHVLICQAIDDDEKLDVDGSVSSFIRLVSSLPKLKYSPTDELDKKILSTALPTMLNLMVVPLVNAVDTFYVGQLKDPLALAAQSASNQVTYQWCCCWCCCWC